MAGIYIHVPFCRQACNYCNFHFSVSHKNIDEYIHCIQKEIEMTTDYLNIEGEIKPNGKIPIGSVYLGGGTPSLLDPKVINAFFEKLRLYYTLDPIGEYTLEANPDDLTIEKLEALAQTPINRLSIGIQSFRAEDLKYMNRIHSPLQALNAISNAQKAGFNNLTIDLIYGVPGMDDQAWIENIQKATEMGINHISTYALTIEPHTPLDVFIRKGKSAPVSEMQSARQFEILIGMLEKKGFLHYEISNFARPGFMSRHNTSYWQGKPYLGLGPSAHSFNKSSRRWNISNTSLYIKGILQGKSNYEEEHLDMNLRYNEYVMTSLRTMWGIDKKHIVENFDEKFLMLLEKEIKPYLESGDAIETKGHICLSPKGRLFADRIASDCFSVD